MRSGSRVKCILYIKKSDCSSCWCWQLDPVSAGSGSNYRWWEEAELKDLCATVGLVNFQRERRLRFIMFSASKPELAEQR